MRPRVATAKLSPVKRPLRVISKYRNTRHVPTPGAFIYIMKHLPYIIPDIHEGSVTDRSESHSLRKALLLVQVGWFCSNDIISQESPNIFLKSLPSRMTSILSSPTLSSGPLSDTVWSHTCPELELQFPHTPVMSTLARLLHRGNVFDA
jgi:hypothetical protein